MFNRIATNPITSILKSIARFLPPHIPRLLLIKTRLPTPILQMTSRSPLSRSGGWQVKGEAWLSGAAVGHLIGQSTSGGLGPRGFDRGMGWLNGLDLSVRGGRRFGFGGSGSVRQFLEGLLNKLNQEGEVIVLLKLGLNTLLDQIVFPGITREEPVQITQSGDPS